VVSAPGEVTAVQEGVPAEEIQVTLRRLVNNVPGSPEPNTVPDGTLAGFVQLRVLAGATGAADVWVVTDSGESARTDVDGHFEILLSAPGRRLVSIDVDRLPAGLRPGEANAVSTLIQAGQTSRVELEVVPVQTLEGMVEDTEGNPAPKGIVLRLLPKGNYTTTNESGRFVLYEAPEGNYTIQLVESSLPEGARMASPGKVPVTARYGTEPAPVRFRYKPGSPGSEPQKDLLPRGERIVLFSTGSPERPERKRQIITSTGGRP
jgi:hypothetical protein